MFERLNEDPKSGRRAPEALTPEQEQAKVEEYHQLKEGASEVAKSKLLERGLFKELSEIDKMDVAELEELARGVDDLIAEYLSDKGPQEFRYWLRELGVYLNKIRSHIPKEQAPTPAFLHATLQ